MLNGLQDAMANKLTHSWSAHKNPLAERENVHTCKRARVNSAIMLMPTSHQFYLLTSRVPGS